MYGLPPWLFPCHRLPRTDAPRRRLCVEELESRRLLTPVLVTPATAAVDPGGMTIALSVVATDSISGNVLTYTWSATAVPAGASPPRFGAANGTSNAAQLVATCTQIGSYGFTVTIANQNGESLASSTSATAASPAPNSVSVTVQSQTLVTSSPDYAWYPQLNRMANGNLLLLVQIVPDETILNDTTPVEQMFLSTDNGRTWANEGTSDFNTHSMITLSDGTFYGLWFNTICTGDTVTTKAIRSTDNGQTFSIDENVPVSLPASVLDPQGLGMVWACDGGLVQMPNGDLLASIYGGAVGPSPNASVLIESTDGGNSWNYVSTIAFDPNQPDEGYDEPSLIYLGGNRLLSTLRTGTTMYQAASADGGLTWSAPAPIASFGVEPDLIQTDDGILVCSSGDGNPNYFVYVMCSGDGLGQQWGPQTILYQGGRTTGYTAMAQVGPNEILVVFDNFTSGQQPSSGPDEVFADLLTVQRLPAILTSPASGLTTTKSGTAADFSVTLRSQPDADVTLSISSSDPTAGSVSPTSLTFTPANWDSPQQVVVTGQDNLAADGNVSYSIVLGAAASADPAFNGATCPSVSVTNRDDVTCVWTGAAGDGNWMNAANWLNANVPQPGDDLIFSGPTPENVNNNFPAGTSFHAIVFQAGDFSLAGNSIGLDPIRGTVFTVSSGTVNLPSTSALPSASSLTVSGGGTLIIGGETPLAGLAVAARKQAAMPTIATTDADGPANAPRVIGPVEQELKPRPESVGPSPAAKLARSQISARAIADVALSLPFARALPGQTAEGNSTSSTSRTAEQAVDQAHARNDWRRLPAAETLFNKPHHQSSTASHAVILDADGRPVL